MMTNDKRLQEIINRRPSRWGNLSIKEFERDIRILQRQAEERRVLEEKIKKIKEVMSVTIDELHYANITGSESNKEQYIKNSIRFIEEALEQEQ